MINNVRVGDISVLAQKKRYWSQQKLATIDDGQTTDVDFALVHK